VIAERVEVRGERACRQGQARPPQQPVRGRAQEQPAVRAQHAPHLRQPRRGVGHVLDHLTRPHDVEARVRQRPGRFAVHELELELGMALARAAKRLGCDVDAHHLQARAGELGREAPFGAADVERTLACGHPPEQEGAAQREVRRLETAGHCLPDRLVVRA